MRTRGPADVSECRRRLTIGRVSEGYPTQAAADFLGVDPSTVRRWIAAFRDRGDDGLVIRPVPGRPGKLTTTREKVAPRWLTGSPLHHGFKTELWTARASGGARRGWRLARRRRRSPWPWGSAGGGV